MTKCKNMTDRLIKRVGFLLQAKEYLNIWPPRKALKRLLQYIYFMLDLLYHTRISLVTTFVDGSIF